VRLIRGGGIARWSSEAFLESGERIAERRASASSASSVALVASIALGGTARV